MPPHAHLAIDLGAESGRAIVGLVDHSGLSLHEVHRFQHAPVQLPTGLHWDFTGLWRQITLGLAAAGAWSRDRAIPIESVGVDTWGVDFGLVSDGGDLLGLPHCYRDPQNAGAFERVTTGISQDDIYAATGIQLMAINSLFQLAQRAHRDSRLLVAASRLLFMPDLFHRMLGGRPANELTIASTSQMIDPRSCSWAAPLLSRAGLPLHLLGELVLPGTCLGELSPVLADAAGLPGGIRIVAPACHDTASAVAAVPAAEGSNWCFLSSGTWSLLGAELDAPCMTDAARRGNFTNELGVPVNGAPTVRFLKNIIGLWMVQECKRHFDAQGAVQSYEDLVRLASEAEPFRTVLNVGSAPFSSPGNMPGKIVDYARRSGQPEPRTPGEFVRSCLESLALAYRLTLSQLEAVLGRRFDVVHVVGGGSKNRLLNQMAADATGRLVVAGPHEATAAGNVLVQAIGCGHLASLAELRRTVAQSFTPEEYRPRDTTIWASQSRRFVELIRGDEELHHV